MATYMTTMTTLLLLLLLPLVNLCESKTTDIPQKTQDLVVATEEMSRANYFTFVMLLNMFPVDKIQENITFLLPNDRSLAKTLLRRNAVSEFLLRHAIPSPLLFEQLQLIPSGSSIPSSDPGFMLRIKNNGGRNFFLNNVKIANPNICTAGSSIRCHGIDGILKDAANPSSPTCSPAVNVPEPGPSPPLSPAPVAPVAPAAAPQPIQSFVPKKSGSSWLFHGGLLQVLAMASVPVIIFL